MAGSASGAGRSGWADYAQALDRVTTHIEEHLDQPLNLERLAQVACLSPHHFHRVFHAMRGETLADAVKRVRLQRAAWWLVRSEQPVEAIARRCGFAGAAVLTRSFRQAYGSTPAAYRRAGPHQAYQAGVPDAADRPPSALQVDVRTVLAHTLIGVPHRGPYIRIGEAFERALAHAARQCRRSLGQDLQPQRLMAVYLDDPAAVSASTLRSFAGLVTTQPVDWQAPLQAWALPPGRCAVLRYRGPYASMHAAYRWLFGQWLPNSGFEPGDHPVYEDYLNHPRDVPPAELLTDIVLPLRAGTRSRRSHGRFGA